MINNTDFFPYLMKDLSSEYAAIEERNYQVVDAVSGLLLSDDDCIPDAEELETVFDRDGYYKRLRLLNFEVSIHYNRNLWRAFGSAETPFWVEIMHRNAIKQNPDFMIAFSRYPEFWK